MKICRVKTLSVSYSPSLREKATRRLDKNTEEYIQEMLKNKPSWEVTSINDNHFADDGCGYPLMTRNITFGEK